ncbi:hypothetical protein GCM10010112_07520 [Actinoplanes lobatus]|uniref:Acyltransferase 3 domain-containing protein n=1 Tax=Actinoplanes lobatus TaxID=113568 RepID=A0ABQ4AEC7_9ACTN|nr:hypothetical protein GCM10010112_07520 [Actinoplanes lobatus]GIE39260.1 hypothetical protein Alo02nite_21580 [Actinoplanes lobatus]
MLMKGLRADPTAPLPKRLDSLTSLRFFAAFAVFTHHFTGLGGKTGFGRSEAIFPFSGIGAHGVTFFFVLSGFLMMWVFKPRESPGCSTGGGSAGSGRCTWWRCPWASTRSTSRRRWTSTGPA